MANPRAAPAESEAELRRRVADQPGDAAAWQRLALLMAEGNRHVDAAEAFARAVAAGASATAIAMPYALALSRAGRPNEAVAVAAAAHARRPKDFELANLHGVMLKRAGRLKEAVPVLEGAARLERRSISPLQNLGNVHDLLGQFTAAAAAYAAALKLQPRHPELWRLHGRTLRNAGDLAAAAASLERAFALDPRDPNVVIDLGGTLVDMHETARALAILERGRQLRPEDPGLAVLEGRLLLRTGRRAEAEALLTRVLAGHPGERGAVLMLSRLHGDGDRAAANAVLRAGLAVRPDSVEFTGALIEGLSRSRHGDEAAHIQEAYDLSCRLLEADPDASRQHAKALRTVFMRCLDLDRLDATGTLADLAPRWIAEGYVSALHYELGRVHGMDDRLRIVEWHREWARREARRITPVDRPATPALHTGRRIRVGFMSSDLRDHPVSYFALPLLEGWDRDRFEVFCYSFFEREADTVQARIERAVQFRWWPRRPDAEVAAGIAADGLDILFELGGSTAMNKLDVMAYRPARIGASWLGYPHSAGFEAIDLILTDPYIHPADPRLLIERPFEMPETWVSLGDLGFYDVPIEEGLPEERRGALTFGTMNNPYKFTRACLDAWAAVLRAVPGSRFLFVRPEARVPAFIANAQAAFAARDVDPDRLEFRGIRGRHLPHYNAIDIALDSLPHVGGTTTCETLWMGVPVVSLVGPGFPERLSYSNLTNAGLGDLAVHTPEAYVATAVALAADPARRRQLRHGLRAQIRAHPLGQPDRFARGFYDRVAAVVAQ